MTVWEIPPGILLVLRHIPGPDEPTTLSVGGLVCCEPIDFKADGILDNGDNQAFLNWFLAGNNAADFNGDGFLSNGDIGTFVAAFIAGY